MGGSGRVLLALVCSSERAPRERRRSMLGHLSDLHVLAPKGRTPSQSIDLSRIVSFGRALDPDGRRAKIVRAFESAVRAGATRMVLTGDLTEVGSTEQF